MKFLPKQFKLFTIFQHNSVLLQQAVRLLEDSVSGTGTSLESAYAEIQRIKRQADGILRQAVQQLDEQSIDYPPKNDAWRLFNQLDRILDAVELLAGRLTAYCLGPLPEPAVRLMNLIRNCAELLEKSIASYGEADDFSAQLSGIIEVANEADRLYVEAVRGLFRSESDPVRLIKLNETYGLLQRIVKLFEDQVEAMEGVALTTIPRL
jgi:hypothetical protein